MNLKTNKIILMSLLMFVSVTVLVGCKDVSTLMDKFLMKNESKEMEETANLYEDVEMDDASVEEDVDQHSEEEIASVNASQEDQFIGGKVYVEEDKIRIEGESNLMKDTYLDVGMYSTPFTMAKIFMNFAGVNPVEIQADGSFIVDLEISPDFEKEYSGEIIEVRIEMTAVSQCCEREDLYGEYGENLTGPFVYQHEIFDDLYQKLQASVYVLVGDEAKEYDIETPERMPVPDDYGETEIWIEPELTNDHRFIYIHGKSNLLEGTEIKGAYYAHPNDILPQESGLDYRTYVQPDGTFLLRIGYETFTNEGILKVHSTPDLEIHDPSHVIYETYGENFEKMSGEFVVDYEEGGKMIEFIYEPEALGIEAPKHTSITEEDGELKVQVPDDVLFDFDKSEIKSEAKDVLYEVIELLESLDEGTSIEINGHTDNQGDEDYNLELSEKRAASVEKYLTENGDVNHLDIAMNGYGMAKPIASNEDEEGRERNRRVEIVINP